MKIQNAAEYLLYLGKRDSILITPLRIQKLLYLCQGFHYLYTNKSLFIDEFEAWQYGPVNRDVYFDFQKFGQKPISVVPTKNLLLEDTTKDIVESVWDNYKNYSAFQLVDITHQQTPWLEAYDSYDKIISNSSIREYFLNSYLK